MVSQTPVKVEDGHPSVSVCKIDFRRDFPIDYSGPKYLASTPSSSDFHASLDSAAFSIAEQYTGHKSLRIIVDMKNQEFWMPEASIYRRSLIKDEIEDLVGKVRDYSKLKGNPLFVSIEYLIPSESFEKL